MYSCHEENRLRHKTLCTALQPDQLSLALQSSSAAHLATYRRRRRRRHGGSEALVAETVALEIDLLQRGPRRRAGAGYQPRVADGGVDQR